MLTAFIESSFAFTAARARLADYTPRIRAALASWATASIVATVSEFVTYPLDLLKTRLQLQNELVIKSALGRAAVPTLSLTSTARRVIETEGFRSLFRGCSIAIVRQWINAGVSVSLYPSVRALLLRGTEDNTTAPLWKRTAAGAITGVIAQALAQPTDVVKVRLQADGRLRLSGGKPRYTGVVHAFREVIKTEGVRGLYVAMGSSVWRAGIISAVGFSSYDHTKQMAVRSLGDTLTAHTIAALVCGVVTAVVSCPLDVVKTRVINNPTLYKGPNDAFLRLVKNEGFLSMFKGLLPTYQRQAVWNGVFWICFEQLQKLTGGERI